MMLGKYFLQIIAILLQFTILPNLIHSVDSFRVKTSNSILHQSNPSFLNILPAYRCSISPPQEEKITRTGSSIFRCYGFYHPQSLRQQRQSEHKASREKFVINEDITFKQIRVIIPSIIDDTPDESLGVITREEALAAAKQRNSDLVLINDKANPPVCKIVDFGKFKYNQAKKKRDQQKTSHKSQADMKEIKLSYKIDTHDIQFKQKSALGFLQEGDRVCYYCCSQISL
jgi:translation initiation factor IF-3